MTRDTYGLLSPRGLLAFLLLPVFLFWGPSLPPLVLMYFLLLWAVLLLDGSVRVSWTAIVGLLSAILLEITYRYRAEGSVLGAGLTGAAFFGALLGANASDYVGKGRRHFLLGNVLVLGLIALQRVLGRYLGPTEYDFNFSPERTVGPGIPDPNIFALVHLTILLPLMAARDLSRGERACVALLMLSIPIYSMSRTALLAVAVLFLMGYPAALRLRLRTRAVAFVVLLTMLAVGGSMLQRLDRRIDVETAVGNRMLYAVLGAETIVREATFFGVPNNEHLKVHQLSLNPRPSYHNTYVSLIAAAGVPAILGFILVFYAVVRRYRSRERVGAVMLLNLLFLTTGGLISIGYPTLLGVRDDSARSGS